MKTAFILNFDWSWKYLNNAALKGNKISKLKLEKLYIVSVFFLIIFASIPGIENGLFPNPF